MAFGFGRWFVETRLMSTWTLRLTVAQCFSVGSLYWARNGVLGFRNLNDCSSTDAENKYNVFRLICFPRSNWKTCSWYRCCCWERLLFSLWFSHLVRIWNQTLKRLGPRIDILISDLAVLPFGLSRRVWRWEKFGSGQDGCFTSSDVAMGNYQLAYC